MKKVKLIIELDEDLYKAKIQGTTSNRQDGKILECVKNGTPLEDKTNGEIFELLFNPYRSHLINDKFIYIQKNDIATEETVLFAKHNWWDEPYEENKE